MSWQWYHISASIIVWIVVLFISIYQFVVSFSDPKKGKRKAKINEFGYSVKVVLSQPMNNFELKDNSIAVQVINITKDKIDITFNIKKYKLTDAYKKSDLFGNQYFRLFFTIISKSKSLPMTHIKAAQTLTTGKIFVNGVEVEEQWTGRHLYYPINEWIKDEDIADVKQLAVKSHQLIFCSKQTFCPNFENPLIQEFGQEIDQKDRKTKAVIIRQTLEWFEVSIFYALLLNLTFLAQVLMVLIDLKTETKLYTHLALCAVCALSGLLPLFITDLVSGFYICVFRRANNVWSFIRVLYLFCMLVVSILSSIGTQVVFNRFGDNEGLLSTYLSTNSSKNKLEDGLYDLLVHIILFVVSLLITFTVWILLLGLIKYCYNCTFHYPTADQSYQTPDDTTTTESSCKTPDRKHKEEVITTPISQIDKTPKKGLPPKTSPQPTHSPQPPPSPQSVGSVKFKTDRLEEEIKKNSSDNKLVGKSVIHESTGSDGYLNPENFRITK